MKFGSFILSLALLGLFSLNPSEAANETVAAPPEPPVTPEEPLTDPYTSPYYSPGSYTSDYDYGGPKRFSANVRYTAVRRIRKSNTGSGAGTGGTAFRGNRNANRNRNRKGIKHANRSHNKRGRVNHNNKRQAAKGRRSNGKHRMNNRRGAPVVRVG